MDERRRYFRINDEFLVRYAVCDAGGPSDRAGETEARALRNLMGKIRESTPALAEALTLLERRIVILEDADKDMVLAPAEVVPGLNLSGCGVAFWTNEKLAAGQTLDLELMLEGGTLRLRVVGKVIRTEKGQPDPGQNQAQQFSWFVRVDLVEMHPDDEEILVQHVLRRQVVKIRENRATQHNNPSH